MTDLNAIAKDHLRAAMASEHGRSAVLVAQDGPLRQTVLALKEGVSMGEHNAPHAATLYVLEGSIAVVSAGGRLVLGEGQLAVVPQERHAVEALEDAVFLLTAVTAVP
ncbi:cupin domain-containing protein [Pseudarthrobacter sp. P1]|uniref:cupin domain-containing protein n=1 Tax=Pseudarthrobacter sp. P1 TaxID=3418418 RepID=UPI003CFB4531